MSARVRLLRIVFRSRHRHQEALRRIAELEEQLREIPSALDLELGTPPSPAASFAAVPRLELVPPLPPAKKPERFVPVLDEDYFDRKHARGDYAPQYVVMGGTYVHAGASLSPMNYGQVYSGWHW